MNIMCILFSDAAKSCPTAAKPSCWNLEGSYTCYSKSTFT